MHPGEREASHDAYSRARHYENSLCGYELSTYELSVTGVSNI